MTELDEPTNYKDWVGEYIDVDSLQEELKEHGFDKGNRGDRNNWYETVASNVMGYVAVLEAEKKGVTYLFTVDSMQGDAMIVGVKRQ